MKAVKISACAERPTLTAPLRKPTTLYSEQILAFLRLPSSSTGPQHHEEVSVPAGAPPPLLDASIFGCAARFNLFTIDVLASINGRRFQTLPVISQSLPSIYAAELSKDGEIFNSNNNDDFPFVRQILISLRRVIIVINLIYDNNNNNKGNNNNYIKVS
jgi:hypothetical protein